MPPGVHAASLIEITKRFGTGTTQRLEVTQRLHRILDLAFRTGRLRRAFLWGSYVTNKSEPNDIDIMLVMASDFRMESCDNEEQAVFDGERVEDELGATVLWMREDVSADLLEAVLELWQVGRGGLRQGIVEVLL